MNLDTCPYSRKVVGLPRSDDEKLSIALHWMHSHNERPLFDLAEESSERGAIVCVYRGLHCPVCATYLMNLEKHVDAFEERGLGVIAISSDTQERAQRMAGKIKAVKLRVGFVLSLSKAREWGLYIYTSRGKTSIDIEEPALFSEPGQFVINPDQSLYFASVALARCD